MTDTLQAQNDAERERVRIQIRDRARVFREAFGTWSNPTKHGEIILQALVAKFGNTGHVLPPNILDNHGRTDPYQTWRRLGHFDVLEYIKQQLEFKESEHVHPSSPSPQ